MNWACIESSAKVRMRPAAAARATAIAGRNSGEQCGGGWSAATRSGNSGRCSRTADQGSGGAGGRFKLSNTYGVAGGVGDLRKRETQPAGLFEKGGGMSLRLHIRADAADVAQFVTDGTQLRHQEQQCET